MDNGHANLLHIRLSLYFRYINYNPPKSVVSYLMVARALSFVLAYFRQVAFTPISRGLKQIGNHCPK